MSLNDGFGQTSMKRTSCYCTLKYTIPGDVTARGGRQQGIGSRAALCPRPARVRRKAENDITQAVYSGLARESCARIPRLKSRVLRDEE